MHNWKVPVHTTALMPPYKVSSNNSFFLIKIICRTYDIGVEDEYSEHNTDWNMLLESGHLTGTR